MLILALNICQFTSKIMQAYKSHRRIRSDDFSSYHAKAKEIMISTFALLAPVPQVQVSREPNAL
jgi:hypothetical protein